MTRSIKALVIPRILAKIDLLLTIGDANDAYYRHYGVTDGRLVRSSLPIDIGTYDRVLAARSDAPHACAKSTAFLTVIASC